VVNHTIHAELSWLVQKDWMHSSGLALPMRWYISACKSFATHNCMQHNDSFSKFALMPKYTG
jgi:hypothetical protein